ncbi:MAG TPA: hypothetical protein VG457_15130 [Planctomycetota bacterium]|jgi:hypothetical protein|nr:hypothetical protein [Planctomycetota bacterium]
MTRRNSILGLLFGILLSFSVSCIDTEPGALVHRDGPIPGITVGHDGPEEVVKVLGQPASRASGWWQDEHRFDMEFKVWYYKGVGRVIFASDMTVFATEADKTQGGLPN